MSAPIDPSISGLLRGSSLAPMMDQPVSHILHSMGLPQLPSLPPAPPLPGLPPLPQIDLSAIVRPLTDMVSAFGTGQFGGGATHPVAAAAPSNPPATNNAPAVGHPPAGSAPASPQSKPATPNAPAATSNAPQPSKPGAPAGSAAPGSGPASHPNTPDPTQVLQAIGTALQTALPLGTSALQLVMQLWQGAGSQQAASTGTQAAASGTELASQSGTQKTVLGAGAGSVALGGAQMGAVMGKYLTTAAITAPFLVIPGGQAFLLEATAEAITEGLAVTANTRAQMAVHSANMTVAGKKVKVTAAPTGVKSVASLTSSATDGTSSGSSLQQLMQLLSPASSLLSTGMQSAQQLATAGQSLTGANAAKPIADNVSGTLGDNQGGSGGSGGLGGGGFGGGGSVAAVPAAAPLSPWSGTAPAGTASPASATGALSTEPVGSTSAGGSSPMMPMGGGAAMGAAKSTTTASAIGDSDGQANLVTSTNGDAVVGPMEGVTLPVVGALAGPQAIEAPPDKELTL